MVAICLSCLVNLMGHFLKALGIIRQAGLLSANHKLRLRRGQLLEYFTGHRRALTGILSITLFCKQFSAKLHIQKNDIIYKNRVYYSFAVLVYDNRVYIEGRGENSICVEKTKQ